jgi:hypothetical protein
VQGSIFFVGSKKQLLLLLLLLLVYVARATTCDHERMGCGRTAATG